MSAAPGPPAPGDPGFLGPFRVLGRRPGKADGVTPSAGSVLVAAGPDGRTVNVVLLGPGPSSDAAARDRFAAAVAELADRRPGSVLTSDLTSPGPWVALAPGTFGLGAERGAGRGARPGGDPRGGADASAELLAATVPPTGRPVSGPQFSPHWKGTNRYPVPPPAPLVMTVGGVRHWRRWVLLALLLLLLLLLLLWWLLARDPGGASSPQPTVTVTTATPDTGSPSSTPGSGTSGTPTTGTRSGSGPGREPGLLPGTPLPTVPARLAPDLALSRTE